MLAPVGAHNRLQCARVERILVAHGKDAPYDMRLVKSVAAKPGERKLVIGRLICFELGGVRYDEKHYTRFRRVLCTEFPEPVTREERTVLGRYGVTRIIRAAGSSDCEILNELRSGGCVLLKGAGAFKRAEFILSAVRGEDDCAHDFRKYLT